MMFNGLYIFAATRVKIRYSIAGILRPIIRLQSYISTAAVYQIHYHEALAAISSILLLTDFWIHLPVFKS